MRPLGESMSDTSQGTDWWLATDGKWYPPEALTETHDFENDEGPVPAHKHGNGGGWVANSAVVADTAFVGPSASVFGRARVLDNSSVSDSAWVCGDAVASGDSRVHGDAVVEGNAQILGHGEVGGDAYVTGIAVIKDYAKVAGNAQIVDDQTIGGNTQIFVEGVAIPQSPNSENSMLASQPVVAATKFRGAQVVSGVFKTAAYLALVGGLIGVVAVASNLHSTSGGGGFGVAVIIYVIGVSILSASMFGFFAYVLDLLIAVVGEGRSRGS